MWIKDYYLITCILILKILTFYSNIRRTPISSGQKWKKKSVPYIREYTVLYLLLSSYYLLNEKLSFTTKNGNKHPTFIIISSSVILIYSFTYCIRNYCYYCVCSHSEVIQGDCVIVNRSKQRGTRSLQTI